MTRRPGKEAGSVLEQGQAQNLLTFHAPSAFISAAQLKPISFFNVIGHFATVFEDIW